MNSPARIPQRIVCLTSETTEIVFTLGAAQRLVGVPGYATRPPEAAAKARIGGFTSVDVESVLELKPDLVISFSDLQKDIVRELLGSGTNVLALNQRSLSETMDSILMIGRCIGCEEKARETVEEMQTRLHRVQAQSKELRNHPRVYFEEWDDPMISGIGWIGEMIEMAGGVDIFPENRSKKSARERIVDADLVVERDPQIILAAWCGKRVDVEAIQTRPGWTQISAVKNRHVLPVEDELFLSPGPALIEGTETLLQLFQKFQSK